MEIDIINSPDGYKFKHPCGKIKKEEKFFYDPYEPKPRLVIIDDLEQCKDCVSFFDLGLRQMCQGIEIKVTEPKVYEKELEKK